MMLKTLGLVTLTFALSSALSACGSDATTAPAGGGGSTGAGGATAGGGSSANADACAGASDPANCTTCLDTAVQLGETIDALVTCTCSYCWQQLQACYQGPDQTENDKCRAVVSCGQTNGCKGTECYCGVGVSITDCLNNGPTGPCKDQIAVAAGCDGETDPAAQAVCVQTARGTAGSTLALASDVGACSTGDPGLTPPAEGNCSNL